MNADVTGSAFGANAMVQLFSTPLKGRLQVATALADASKSQFTGQLINSTIESLTLIPRECLSMVQPEGVITRKQLAFTMELKQRSGDVIWT